MKWAACLQAQRFGCIAVAVLGILLVLPYCHFVVCNGMPYRRYDGNSTCNQHNKVSPPLGHWNPETLEPPSRNTGTLEPRDIGTPSAQGGERGRVSLPSRSWRLRRPGWCTLVAGTVFGLSFSETLKGRCGPHSYSGAVGSPSLNESWRAVLSLSPALSKRPTVAVEFERNAF